MCERKNVPLPYLLLWMVICCCESTTDTSSACKSHTDNKINTITIINVYDHFISDLKMLSYQQYVTWSHTTHNCVIPLGDSHIIYPCEKTCNACTFPVWEKMTGSWKVKHKYHFNLITIYKMCDQKTVMRISHLPGQLFAEFQMTTRL